MHRLCGLVALILFFTPAEALYSDTELPFCRNGGFPSEGTDFAFYRVTGKAAALLQDSEGFEKDCPNPAIQHCRRGEIPPGTVLLINKIRNGFACAYVGASAGWVPLSDVEKVKEQPPRNPPISAWNGLWSAFDDTIKIRVRKGRLYASGNGYWPGKHYKQKDGMAAQHFGGFDLSAIPQGNEVTFKDEEDTEYGCVVHAILFGKYLIVTDNSSCGALNVRFEGLFTKPTPGHQQTR